MLEMHKCMLITLTMIAIINSSVVLKYVLMVPERLPQCVKHDANKLINANEGFCSNTY